MPKGGARQFPGIAFLYLHGAGPFHPARRDKNQNPRSKSAEVLAFPFN